MKKALKWVAIVFVGLIILGAIIGGGDDSQDLGSGTVKEEDTQQVSNVEEPKESSESKKPALELLDHEYVQEEFSGYIVGTIINNTDKEYSYVQIEINLLDEEGNLIGSTLDNINNLGPGQKWKFKAIVLEDGVASYEIKDITGF